ncbi:MAG: hypothetical protein HOH33_12030 [Verrucomicrobia bacterium]|jgi:hypothetical protein|nr:hypothetical protein [Verrucomicrobiota bacterium]
MIKDKATPALSSGHSTVPLAMAMVLTGMAGAMGWGIRGQYGHETGAMIAGVLVASVLVMLFCPMFNTLSCARAIAWVTIGISFGGCMTYGQTVGLTHDAALVGNTEALRWGMIGLFIKGGIWIGFTGVILGMALGGHRYTTAELGLMFTGMIFLIFLGIFLLNEPYRPADGSLPRIYFSDHWNWEPDSELKPRREKWGGLLMALAGLWAYTGIIKRDALALRMGIWGVLGGGLGFSCGQSLQAFHAWHPEWFAEGFLLKIDGVTNWWNMMETTFGALFGAILALGLWANRHLIKAPHPESGKSEINTSLEWALLVIYLLALASWSFISFPALDQFADLAITMGMLPFIAASAGRFWPFWVCLPVTLLPIAGKSVRYLVHESKLLDWPIGWVSCLIIPLTIAFFVSLYWAERPRLLSNGRMFCRSLLALTAWIYFLLNFAFFHFPWPWADFNEWTARTPNNLIFLICLLGLTLGAIFTRKENQVEVSTSSN